MGFLSVLSFSQKIISDRLHPGDIAIDATMGTGVDTLFLAQKVERKGVVYAFDIQKQALLLTQMRLRQHLGEQNFSQVTLCVHDHAQMSSKIAPDHYGKVSGVMFNLGYLPTEGIDKRLITTAQTTIPALEQALQLLKINGVITIVLYPGHPGGQEEASVVQQWAALLPTHAAQTMCYRLLQNPQAPYMIAIEKKSIFLDLKEDVTL